MPRIAFLGGGSNSWGPAFLRGIFITPALSGSTAVRHGIDGGRLDPIHRPGHKILAGLVRVNKPHLSTSHNP